MTASETATPTTVTLIVADDFATPRGTQAARGEGVRDDFAEHALPFFAKAHKSKEVSLDKLQQALGKAQAEVAALLRGVTNPNVPGFRLNTVEIELSVSAEGSIGIATAGAEASLTLSFERDARASPEASSN
jgi:dihydroxyacetone kinase